MNRKNFKFQGTRYASRAAGYFALEASISYHWVTIIARRLLYARHRRSPDLLQFLEAHGTAIAIDHLKSDEVRDLVLNIDERMRLFITCRDPRCDIETIRFHFEELMYPWLTGAKSHTICTSQNFFVDHGLEEKRMVYPRSKYGLYPQFWTEPSDNSTDAPN
jgi:hypothetical protein